MMMGGGLKNKVIQLSDHQKARQSKTKNDASVSESSH